MSVKARRGLLLWPLIIVAVGTLMLSVEVSSPTKAQTTTPQVFSNTSSISIVDATSAGASPANPYPSEITVQGLSGTISDVNVKLNGYSHGFPDDVAVQVVGPDGTSVLLMSDVGGPLPFGSAPVSGINLTVESAIHACVTSSPARWGGLRLIFGKISTDIARLGILLKDRPLAAIL
jgi:hypothetical protein